jgi:membrane AbrB-like protein
MKPIQREHVTIAGRLLAALVLGTIGGAIFRYFNLPLAWMLGAMTACGIGAILHLPIGTPAFVRAPMSAVIGSMLGTSFTLAIFTSIATWAIPIAGLLVYIFVSGGLCYFYYFRVVGLDRPTAYFSGMPGGLLDMVILGGANGGDERTIALIQSARVFLVVLLFPTIIHFLTGAELASQGSNYRPLGVIGLAGVVWFIVSAWGGIWLGQKLRLPAPFLIGPMLLSAALHLTGLTHFTLPSVVVAAAQVALGCTVGCRFVGTPPAMILRVLAQSVGATLVLLMITVVFAEVISHLTGIPAEGVMLAYSPGGLAEMSLVAYAVGVDVPMVVAHHMIRVFMVIAGAAAIFKLQKR